jgi:hypothetical protein
MEFKKAVKQQRFLKIAVGGVSGSGKTYSALSIASGLFEKVGGNGIVVGDTENHSASLYSDYFDFFTADIPRPKNNVANALPGKNYIDFIQSAIKNDFKVAVIDSFSHFWDEILIFVDQRNKTNSFSVWKEATPIFEKVINYIINAPIHIIVTLRGKTEYILETQDRNGKNISVPKKVGLGVKFRDGWEYEFDVVAHLDNTVMTFDKTRISTLQNSVIEKPTKEFGHQLFEWLNNGVEVAHTTPETIKETSDLIDKIEDKKVKNISLEQVNEINLILESFNEDSSKILEKILSSYNVKKLEELTDAVYSKTMKRLNVMQAQHLETKNGE